MADKKSKSEAGSNDLGQKGVGLFSSKPSANLNPFDLKKTMTKSEVMKMYERSPNADHIGRLMKMRDDHLSRLVGIPKEKADKFKKELTRYMKDFTRFPSLKDALKEFKPRFEAVNEGGPGSGVGYSNTMPIGMPIGEVTIGKRSEYMKNNRSYEAEVDLSQIKSVGQKNYVPTKMSKMLANWQDVKDKPVDLLKINSKEFQVLDGHHRFLSAKAQGQKKIKARVYESVNEKSKLLVPGEWKLVSNHAYKGWTGRFLKDNLDVIFWKSGEAEMFFDFKQTSDVKPKDKTIEMRSGRSLYKFERVQ